MTPEAIHAIEMVLMFNNDICELYEKRGISRDDMRELFRLATLGTHFDVADKATVNPILDWLEAHGDELKQYDDRYVAVSATGVVAVSSDLGLLNKEISKLGRANDVIVMHGPFNPPL